jgi:predicted enzyme related to lactoylglutathione lyase
MERKLSSFPIICTDSFAKTVAFYEDMFDFVPAYETDTFVHLVHREFPNVALGIIDIMKSDLPDQVKNGNSQGVILAFMTSRFEETYNELYYEGVEVIKKPYDVDLGYRSFLVADPYNKVVIDVITAEPVLSVEPVPESYDSECCEKCECNAA